MSNSDQILNVDKRIAAFVKLGTYLRHFGTDRDQHTGEVLHESFYTEMEELIERMNIHNPWYTPDNIRRALSALGDSLEESAVTDWLSAYAGRMNISEPKTVAVIMAGNIPLVGFHDFLCVLVSGHRFLGKLSSDDKFLLPFVALALIAIEPAFAERIAFSESQLKEMDAVIATGSNNSARYFDYYFGKYPNIIRRNRNSVAVLMGDESKQDLFRLGIDIFSYFGLGCRSVSKVFVPTGYKFDTFYESIYSFKDVVMNNKYANNYEYNRTIYLMGSNADLLDNNFLLLKQDNGYSSPIGVLFYEYYDDLQVLRQRLKADAEQIQVIVSDSEELPEAIPFGVSQSPRLSDYADGVNTMEFLLKV
jgi:hypothetical protein